MADQSEKEARKDYPGMCETERMLAIARTVTSPEGFAKLISDAQDQVKRAEAQIIERTNMIATLDRQRTELAGKKQAMEAIVLVLEKCKQDWGIADVTTVPMVDSTGSARKVEQVTTVSPEVQRRAEERKLCMFKDRATKQWCSRTLRTKAAKTSGYCDVHRDIVSGKVGGPEN